MARWFGRTAFGIVALLLLLCISQRSLAQGVNTGTIAGNVADRSGAVIPNAQVTLTSETQGMSRMIQSNASGEYVFNAVPVGTWTLRVQANGFAEFVAQGILVDANRNVTVNASLQLAKVTNQVTVTDTSGSTIDTQSGTVGELISNQLVQDLPLDGGNAVETAELLPGVAGLNAPTTFTGERSGPTYSVSGSRNTQNLMLLDGSMWNNLFYNTGLNYPPRQGLQEVSVLLNNFEAEYGRNAGSVFNVVTRSGSDQLHGMLWEYAENNAFNAADYLSHDNPKLVSNQFGGTMGGPILRDKLFFFGTFQNIRIAGTNTGLADVQTYNERGLTSTGAPLPCSPQGNFPGQNCASFAADTPANKQSANGPEPWMKNPLYNYAEIATSDFNTAYQVAGGSGQSPCVTELEQALKTTGEYLTEPELPSVCFNPVILNVLNKYVPRPSSAAELDGGVPTYTSAPYPHTEYDGLMRVDYNTNRNSLNARYYISDNADLEGDGVSSSTLQGLANYEVLANSGLNNFGGIQDTRTLTPNMLNVATLSYKRYVNEIVPTDPTTLDQLGGQMQSFGTPTLPEFNFNIYDAGSTSEAYQNKLNEDIEFDDSLAWTHGAHNAKFGVSLLRLQYMNKAQYPGYIQFSTTFTGDTFADAMAGLVNELDVANEDNQAGIEHEIFAYAQDDWRALPRVTFNLGIRYELPLPWYQPDRESDTFIPGYQSAVFPTAPAGLAYVGDKGIPRGLINPDYTGVEPRFGFAWDMFGKGKSVLRGGFGIFHDAVNANVIGVGEPFYDRFNYATPCGGASEPMLSGANPCPSISAVPDYYNPKAPAFVPPFSLYFPDKNFVTPYVLAGNFGIQQSITKNANVEIDYVGKFGRHLTVPIDLNPAIYDCSGAYYQSDPSVYCPSPTAAIQSESYEQRVRYQNYNYGGQGLVDFSSLGWSSYNGLQVMYNERATHSLTMIATYTYSRSLDVDTNGQDNNNAIPDVYDLRSEYGPSDYNVKHNVTAGWVYYLPKLREGYAWTHALLNDWQFNGIYQARTGLPFNVTMNNDQALTDEPNQRPALLPGVNPLLPSGRSRAQKIAEYFNVAAFAEPNYGTYSTLSRNKFTGPAYMRTDFTLGRQFPLHFREDTSLSFRADAFNVWNTPNLHNPNVEFECSTTTPMVACATPGAGSYFGVIQTTYGSNAALNSNGRRLQLSLTLRY